MYWINYNIGHKEEIIQAGQFHPLEQLAPSSITKLLAKGIIQEIRNPPPVAKVTGLEKYATILEASNIYTLMDILDLRVTGVIDILGIAEEEAQTLIATVTDILTPGTRANGSHR